MLSKKQVRKKRQWQGRIVRGRVDNIRKRKGVTGLLFQLLDKFGMLTWACFLYNALHLFW